MDNLDKNNPEKAVRAALDTPKEGQRGVTLSHAVVRMRPGGGSPQYKASIRLHEFMHLLGLNIDHAEFRQSVMSYPYSGPGPVDLSLLSLHESGGYLFARYALAATSARREGTPSLR
jgi:hypothetical protein